MFTRCFINSLNIFYKFLTIIFGATMILWGMIIFYKFDHVDLLHDSEVATVTKVAFAYMWLRTGLVGLICICSIATCIGI